MRQIDQRFIDYLKEQLRRGVTEEDLKEYLLRKGYRRERIEEGLEEVKREEQAEKEGGESRDLHDQIYNYLKKYYSQGYDLVELRSHLINQGYPSKTIDRAIEEVTKGETEQKRETTEKKKTREQRRTEEKKVKEKKEKKQTSKDKKVKHEHHIPWRTTVKVAGIFLGVAVVAVLTFFFLKNMSQKRMLDVSVTTDQIEVSPGEKLYYTVELFNLGEKERFDVRLEYKILDSENNVEFSKEDTVAIETSQKFNRDLPLSSDLERGEYKLRIYAKYRGETSTAYTSFKVREESERRAEEEEDQGGVTEGTEQNRTREETEEQGEEQAGGQGGREQNITIDEQVEEGQAEEVGEELNFEKIGEEALNNPGEAGASCAGAERQGLKDTCYSFVASKSNQSYYCDKIEDTYTRDNCYVEFIMEGDLSVCGEIEDESYSKVCEQMEKIPEATNQTTNYTSPSIKDYAES